MKKNLAKLLVFALALSAVMGLNAARAVESKTMRIGLCFGSGAVRSARLENRDETGFRFGYYDEQQQFVSLAWTGESDISVLITQNIYLTAQGSYTTSAEDSQGAVGCYHVHLPWAYEDFESAYAAAETLEGGFVAWINGAYCVRVGAYPSKEDAEAALAALAVEGAAVKGTSGYGCSVVASGTTRILFQFDAAAEGESAALAVEPGPEGSGGTTTFQDNRYRGGFRFERIGGGAATVVNMVDLEDYVKGLVPYEMSASWPLEALKAQAVCARTYAMNGPRHSSNHFDLCTTTECQVYRGIGSANDHSDQAVDETAGQLARYEGKGIEALYYSSNGGASEDNKNVNGYDFAYLKGKADPYEADIADIAGNYSWSFTGEQVKSKLNKNGYPCGDIAQVTTKLSDVGNVIEITIQDISGKSYTFSRDRVRTSLGLYSIRFTVERSGGVTQEPGYIIAEADQAVQSLDGLYALSGDGTVSALGDESYIITASGVQPLELEAGAVTTGGGETDFVFKGTGWGHNVGMSQWGAYAMAKRGYTYQDILKFYYTDITVE